MGSRAVRSGFTCGAQWVHVWCAVGSNAVRDGFTCSAQGVQMQCAVGSNAVRSGIMYCAVRLVNMTRAGRMRARGQYFANARFGNRAVVCLERWTLAVVTVVTVVLQSQ